MKHTLALPATEYWGTWPNSTSNDNFFSSCWSSIQNNRFENMWNQQQDALYHANTDTFSLGAPSYTPLVEFTMLLRPSSQLESGISLPPSPHSVSVPIHGPPCTKSWQCHWKHM